MRRLSMIMICLLAMMAASTGAKAQQITITLMQGWNWISYPNAVSMDIDEALGDFEPFHGDRLKSSEFSTEYDSEWGWEGELETLVPGQGYMYYSARTEATSFVFAQAPSSFVTTTNPTDITTTSAVVGGTVTIGEGNHVFARGVCWDMEPNPTIDDNHISNGAETGDFSDTLTDLTPSTTYYVRAYVVTDYGLAYGEELSFTTDHSFVDLGLPSGLLWATCNVGANAPEDYGDYFAWGETQPKETYSWSTYQYCNGSSNTLTKYCNNPNYGYNGFTDSLTTLLPEDDAATANWGEDWRMPTRSEWQELFENTTGTWITTQNGVVGCIFTASNGNSIFLPAAGRSWGGENNDLNIYGYYWSSSLCDEGPQASAWGFNSFNSSNYGMLVNGRGNGQSIRPVREGEVPELIEFTGTGMYFESLMGAWLLKNTMSQTVSGDRTHLNYSGPVEYCVAWDSSDQILVINNDGSDCFNATVMSIGSFGTEATFEGDAAFLADIETDSMYTAFYPATNYTTGDQTVSMTIPSVQTFTWGGFDTNLYPMYAANEGTDFPFRSDAGLLTIGIRKDHESENHYTISRIVLEAVDANDQLVGTMTYAYDAPCSMDPTYTKSNTSNVVELVNCEVIGELSSWDTYYFNFVLMEGALTGTFTVTLYDENDQIITIYEGYGQIITQLYGSTEDGIHAQQRIWMPTINLW